MSCVSGLRALSGVVVAVGGRPLLWPTAVRQVRVLARPRWWLRPPFLPLPPPDYLRFRLQTAYGGDGRVSGLRPEDVVAYLDWCRAWRAWHRPRRGAT